MGEACSKKGGEERCIQGFVRKPQGKRGHLEDLGVEGGIILKWISKKCDGDMDWINLAQDRYRWRAVVIAVMKLLIP